MEQMEGISKILKAARGDMETSCEFDPVKREYEVMLQANQRAHKQNPGSCEHCGGTGCVPVIQDGIVRTAQCECIITQNNARRIEKSGLKDIIDKCTFDSFTAVQPWQEKLKNSALKFMDSQGKWFFAGGQVGSGKTHICTAIAGEFMKKGCDVRYMMWATEIVKLKANRNNDEEYDRIVEPLLKAKVLYIDDFFKTEKDKRPTSSDVMVAFEILNYRYINAGLITVISSEKSIDDIMEIDQAIGSRIYQKCKGYQNVILSKDGRNHRLKE